MLNQSPLPNLPSSHLHSHSSCSTNKGSSSSSPSSSSSLTRSIKTFFPLSAFCRFLLRAPPLLPPRPRPSPCSLLIFFNCAVLIFGTPVTFPMPCAASAACTAVLINFWMPGAPLVSPWYSTDGSRELERDGEGDGVRGMMRSCFSASVLLYQPPTCKCSTPTQKTEEGKNIPWLRYMNRKIASG